MAASLIKYRVHEVAKDFETGSKEVSEILEKYATKPKNHMQVLEERELDLIFEYLTLHNQIESLEEVFADTYVAPQEEPKAEVVVEAPAEAPAASVEAAPAVKEEGTVAPAPVQVAPTQAAPAPQKASQASGPASTKKPEKRVVDTSGVTVNLEKYDERIDSLVPNRAEGMQQGKEKFGKRNQKKLPPSGKRRQEERDKMLKLQMEAAKKAPTRVLIPDEISVGELASRMKKQGAQVVARLMKMGVMASLSDVIDYDTAALVAMEMDCKVEREVIITIEERLIADTADKAEDLVPRAPVVVVMGHVDHGKTSLLDRIRNAQVADGEAGGITQHIGAYQVQINGKPITFLDTPGHEAFTSMRARGAKITDIAILVVAADDGIMPQTIESISHAKAAEIPIIVAINKMDKPSANPDKIMQQLTEYELVSEEWGGETIIVPISAKTGMNVDKLLEMVALTAEVQELRANPNREARGTVIEARLDRARGPVMTGLVQNGTLKQGDIIIAGTSVGRVRLMTSDKGETVTTAGPSVPVEIMGMSEVPSAGDIFNAVADERMARQLVAQRKTEQKMAASAPATKVSLDALFEQIKQGEVKTLNVIVKADVQGSAEALKASLEKIANEEVRVRVIHSGVGAINESDVMLADTSGAIITGFNVRPDAAAAESAARSGVDLRMYRVIYDCINEIEAAMKGMLAPKFKEVVLGQAEVRETYKASNVGTICGCYVQSGKIVRGCQVRLVRDGVVVHEGNLGSLRRFKDDVKEVATNYECGLSIEGYNDVKIGDIIEAFTMEQIKVV
ncbi:MAG: translation initiation factor IF-2 [Oscillospiraceae bacterium]|nr:translation initiation factor IF-2 [Oscillospiraceae bacterium]